MRIDFYKYGVSVDATESEAIFWLFLIATSILVPIVLAVL